MFTNYYSYLVDNFQKYLRYTNTVMELNNLTDDDLEILGLTRGEIFVTAYKSTLNK
jgi:uncharacterized protein YjiS (DUF1127 family)